MVFKCCGIIFSYNVKMFHLDLFNKNLSGKQLGWILGGREDTWKKKEESPVS